MIRSYPVGSAAGLLIQMNKINQYVESFNNHDLGILFLRLALGVVFITAGCLKLSALEMTIPAFAAMGFSPWVTHLVAYAELLSGLALVIGVFVRYAGLVLAVIMLVALVRVHWPNGFGLQNGGYEYVFVLLLGALALVTFGAGSYSLGNLLRGKNQQEKSDGNM